MEKIRELIVEALTKDLQQIILSNAVDKQKETKIKVRPIMIKGELLFQCTKTLGPKELHENFTVSPAVDFLFTKIQEQFRQVEIDTDTWRAVILISKKGKVTINKKKKQPQVVINKDLSHNRTKQYILEEGTPVDFLIDLGVQTKEGKIVKAKYDKFKQINRFLEFIQDILPALPKDRKLTMIDFGCGKSYLTFAMYYYLKVLNHYDIRVIGLDLKEDVIDHCNGLSKKYGYDDLTFLLGDISTYEGVDAVDMVVTLHACDTATDYALYKAIKWNAKVILSVPCCQHEVNSQIRCDDLKSVLKYGLLKERISALLTDGMRANILEENGYDTQILEFIDMEHTPKNILIRGVKKEKRMEPARQVKTDSKHLAQYLNVEQTLQKLLQQ
ncbi:MAG: SAM-dependent methyltransferase [Lachnospiraceae bacterium]|nr:SAM-dependent methyltransferase [Lachnospiraceae bacterium]